MLARFRVTSAFLVLALLATVAGPVGAAVRKGVVVGGGNGQPGLLPTGQYITPTIAPGATYQALSTGLRPDGNADANGAITSALSPDGKTLLVLTSGYNSGLETKSGQPITVPYLNPITGQPSTTVTGSFNWVFVYDVSRVQPIKTQQIQLASTFDGLAWSPDGVRFYVSGGQDDRIYIFKKGSKSQGYVVDAPFAILNHNSNDNQPQPTYDGGIFKGTPVGYELSGTGLLPGAQTAGVAVSADGTTLYAANLYDDSVSVIDATQRTVSNEYKLYTPGSTVAQGEYPRCVTPLPGPSGQTAKIYVSSVRDGEVISINNGYQTVIPVGGEPNKMILSKDGSTLYVANGDNDEIDVINTTYDQETQVISLRRPGYAYRGANPNSLALSPDGKTLYVTVAGENAVAVVDLTRGVVSGRIPAGWYPSSVTVSADGKTLYVANYKSNAGPSGGNTSDPTVNEYVLETEKAGLLTLPVPHGKVLKSLSAVVDANNGFGFSTKLSPMMAFLRTKIKHVIFIQRENRTYDQILGDLPLGNGDPALTTFPQPVTPNAHALALQFGVLDNFYDSGDVSVDGWNWNYQGHVNDIMHQGVTLNYAGDGFNGASPIDRLQNLAVPISNPSNPLFERLTTVLDPSLASTVEPGPKAVTDDVGTSDWTPGQTGGYIWDSLIRAGVSFRHYGQYDDETDYIQGLPIYLPIVRNPPPSSNQIQGVPRYQALFDTTDLYFRGWDLNVPDEYRFEEWNTEFNSYVANGNLPSFEFMTLMLDHTGNFSTNVGNLDTPTLEVSSNDHAIGQVVAAVSHSPYWSSTAIFIEEDDAQAGQDHVDAHRQVGFVISPWTKHGAVIDQFYNSDSVLRTIEDLLGADHLGFNDANSPSMDDVFTKKPNLAPYTAIVPGDLCQPPVAQGLVGCAKGGPKSGTIRQRHDGAWWQARTRNLSFDGPDENDALAYDKLLWQGLVGDRPYPSARSGKDLRANRSALLQRVRPPVETGADELATR
jgi:YVTN family beta-propeller protein